MTKHTWLTTTAAAAFAVALAAAPALAQDAGSFDDWDTDTNAAIDQTEWNTGWANQGITGSIDTDDDEMVSQTEFEDAIGDRETFDQRYGSTAFQDWDADGDGMLSSQEMSDGMYTAYDADDSGDWNEEEFTTYRDDVGEDGLFDL